MAKYVVVQILCRVFRFHFFTKVLDQLFQLQSQAEWPPPSPHPETARTEKSREALSRIAASPYFSQV